MENNKKRRTATVAAIALAAALVFGGGTLAYLTGSSGPVENNFAENNNTVTLDEPLGNDVDYNIVPGTSQTKDPTITATYTLDSYVFLKVEDATSGLVTYSIESDWTLLTSSTDNVTGATTYIYYQLLEYDKSTAASGLCTTELGILVGDEVSYSSALTNDDLDYLKTVSLTFDAYIIQAQLGNAGTVSAAVAYSVLNGGAYTETTISSGTASTQAELLSSFNTAASEDNAMITVTTTTATASTLGSLEIVSGGNATISGDNVSVVVDGTYALANKLTVTGSNVILSGPDSGYGPNSATVYRGITVTGEDASLTIESGTYKQDAYQGKVVAAENDATVIVNGGTFAASGTQATVFYANGGTIYLENVNNISASGASSVFAAAENGGTIYISSAVYDKYTSKFSAAGATYDNTSGYYVITAS